MTFFFAAVNTFNNDFTGAGNNNLISFFARHISHRACETDSTGRLGFNVTGNSGTGSGTTNVKVRIVN